MITAGDGAEEFDCIDCGRHIIRLVGVPPDHFCGLCLMWPGWYRDPELRLRLDPEGESHDPDDD